MVHVKSCILILCTYNCVYVIYISQLYVNELYFSVPSVKRDVAVFACNPDLLYKHKTDLPR